VLIGLEEEAADKQRSEQEGHDPNMAYRIGFDGNGRKLSKKEQGQHTEDDQHQSDVLR